MSWLAVDMGEIEAAGSRRELYMFQSYITQMDSEIYYTRRN
jgi:hypothetical protein